MKKLFIFCLSAIMLAACSGKDDQAQDTSVNDESNMAETAEPEKNQQVVNENTERQEKATDVTEDQSDYTELPVVLEKIGSDQLEQIIETDNPDKRIILFEDQNHNKKFKSIFIKHGNRLKVIDLANDRMIFNEVI